MKTKEQTMKKIAKISAEAFKRYGVEVCSFSNYEVVIKNICDELGIPFSRLTLKRHIDKITFTIRGLERDSLKKKKVDLFDFESGINEKPDWITVAELKEKNKELLNDNSYLVKVVLHYSDGSTMDLLVDKKDVSISSNKKEEEVKEIEWQGLFSYNKDGSIVIRRGKKTGCNIKNVADIRKYFNKCKWLDPMTEFEGWCGWMLEDFYAGKVEVYDADHTAKDVDTLKEALRALSKKRTKSNF